jgi:hypothetical protein
MINRFLLDYDNPDAGIGHSMGIINRALKIAKRNELQLVYSESQLIKSNRSSLQWNMKQWMRRLRGKKAYETHNIGNDLNLMLNIGQLLPCREDIEKLISQHRLKILELPRLQINIPSNEQNDDEAYREIDAFIKSHPESNIAFKVSSNLSGDYEYAATKDWFLNVYIKARELHPIALTFNPNQFNIAVHVRRGDLLPGRQYSDLSNRMLPDAWYLKILDAMTHLPSREVAIHIFSEGKDGCYLSECGNPFSWKAHFRNRPYVITEHIDSEFLSTFHHLLHADVLIGSKSGMSHLAGMLSTRIKIMPTMWHSYRGANQLLEVSGLESELNQEAIAKHLQKYLSLA